MISGPPNVCGSLWRARRHKTQVTEDASDRGRALGSYTTPHTPRLYACRLCPRVSPGHKRTFYILVYWSHRRSPYSLGLRGMRDAGECPLALRRGGRSHPVSCPRVQRSGGTPRGAGGGRRDPVSKPRPPSRVRSAVDHTQYTTFAQNYGVIKIVLLHVITELSIDNCLT